ncbi:MAG: hypothetical protein OXR62_02170 [Ahrensia sp.]|nr:hypothetical protein [Ahrensia sp.]
MTDPAQSPAPQSSKQAHINAINALADFKRPASTEAKKQQGTSRVLLISETQRRDLDKKIAAYITEYLGEAWVAEFDTESSNIVTDPNAEFCNAVLYRGEDSVGGITTDIAGVAVLVDSQFGIETDVSERPCSRMERMLFADFMTGLANILNDVLDTGLRVSEHAERRSKSRSPADTNHLTLTLENDDEGVKVIYRMFMAAMGEAQSGPRSNDLDRVVLKAQCMMPVSTRSLAFLRDIKPGDRLECSGDTFLAIRGRVIASGSVSEQSDNRAVVLTGGSNKRRKRAA